MSHSHFSLGRGSWDESQGAAPTFEEPEARA